MDKATFWTMVGAIAQILGSIATFAAVAVALKLANEERSIRLRVTAGFRRIVNTDGHIDVIAITVENIGHRAATIESLFWSTGYVRGWFPLPKILKLQSCFQMEDYDWAINQKFPWELEPGKSKTTFFKRNSFIEQFSKPADNDLFRKLPFQHRWVLLNYKVGVGVTTLQKAYSSLVENKLKETLEAGYEKNR